MNLIELHLQNEGFDVLRAATGQEGVRLAADPGCDLALTDLRLPDLDGVEVMRQMHAINPGLPTIIMTAYGTIDNAVDAMRQGVLDYLSKPMTIRDLVFRINKVFELTELKGQVRYLQDVLKSAHSFDQIFGPVRLWTTCAAMRPN